MDMVLKVAPDEIGQVPVPVPEDQDDEPLDNHADAGEEAIDPVHDSDKDPVEDADEQFKPHCGLFEYEELPRLKRALRCWLVHFFWHNK